MGPQHVHNSHSHFNLVQAAIVSLGIIGAKTNNACIVGMFHNLSSYYYKDPSLFFYVLFLSFFLIFLIFNFQMVFLFAYSFFVIYLNSSISLQVRIA